MDRDRMGEQGKKTVYEVAYPEEEDLQEVTTHKCLTIVEKNHPIVIHQSSIVKRGGKNQAVNRTLLYLFNTLLHFEGNIFIEKRIQYFTEET